MSVDTARKISLKLLDIISPIEGYDNVEEEQANIAALLAELEELLPSWDVQTQGIPTQIQDQGGEHEAGNDQDAGRPVEQGSQEESG
jgi:hypothetical protein